MMKNVWRRSIRVIVYGVALLPGITAITCMVIGIVIGSIELAVGIPAICGLISFLALAVTCGLEDVSPWDRIEEINSWTREGVFKTKPVDNALMDIIKSNPTIMSSIMATANKATKVFALKRNPARIKLIAGTIYCHEMQYNRGRKIIVFTGKRNKSLVFNLSNGVLVNCNINNIFILPAVNEELEAIIGLHEDRSQIETEERNNTVDGFREYVTAISDMLKSN